MGARTGDPKPRATAQRNAIVAALVSAGRPLSPAEILALARRVVRSLGPATVYRTIASLTASGELATVSLPGQPPRYETREAASAHHHHFHCDRCGKVFDVAGCTGDLERLAPPGFDVRRHEVVLYGSCDGCGGGT